MALCFKKIVYYGDGGPQELAIRVKDSALVLIALGSSQEGYDLGYNIENNKIVYGDNSFCMRKVGNRAVLKMCKGPSMSIKKSQSCSQVRSPKNRCLTVTPGLNLILDECQQTEAQCFAIDDEAPSRNSPKDRDAEGEEEDYSMRYYEEEIDEAVHTLAKINNPSHLNLKRTIPYCFEGYKTITEFVVDTLPLLRKKTSKYCVAEVGDDRTKYSYI